MTANRISARDVTQLESWGWEFMPTGPEEWEWLLFNSGGEVIGRQGDERWSWDLSRLTPITR